MKDEFGLCGFEHCERTAGAAEMEQAAAAGGDMLVVAGSGAEEVAELVVASTEALGRGEALEAAHTSDAAFDAAVVLLETIVLVATGAMATRRPSVVRIARG